jgi:hydroxymethylbilane synthase
MTTTVRTVVIGTRSSALARWQTQHVADLLHAAKPDLRIEIVPISTRGDRELNKPLPEIGGKGLFTAELEAALLEGEIALAVHSLKDLPTEDTPGLTIGATPCRADPGDVLVSRHNLPLADLPANPRIGTSSPRRAAQVRLIRPDAEIVPVRGNVETRLRKAQSDDLDGVVLAAAGLARLGLEEHITERLALDTMLPAPGQGALAAQCRADDGETLSLLATIHHADTWAAVVAERAFLAGLGGGCSVPVAACGLVSDGRLTLRCLVASRDGGQAVHVAGEGDPARPETLGASLAQEALEKGAAGLLESEA